MDLKVQCSWCLGQCFCLTLKLIHYLSFSPVCSCYMILWHLHFLWHMAQYINHRYKLSINQMTALWIPEALISGKQMQKCICAWHFGCHEWQVNHVKTPFHCFGQVLSSVGMTFCHELYNRPDNGVTLNITSCVLKSSSFPQWQHPCFPKPIWWSFADF